MGWEDMKPTYDKDTIWKFFCFAELVNSIQGTTYMDLPGKFPVICFQGHQDLNDINAILVKPMQSRSKESVLEA